MEEHDSKWQSVSCRDLIEGLFFPSGQSRIVNSTMDICRLPDPLEDLIRGDTSGTQGTDR